MTTLKHFRQQQHDDVGSSTTPSSSSFVQHLEGLWKCSLLFERRRRESVRESKLYCSAPMKRHRMRMRMETSYFASLLLLYGRNEKHLQLCIGLNRTPVFEEWGRGAVLVSCNLFELTSSVRWRHTPAPPSQQYYVPLVLPSSTRPPQHTTISNPLRPNCLTIHLWINRLNIMRIYQAMIRV